MTNNYDYKEIEKTEDGILEWYKGVLLKERLLHGEIMELLLESVTPLQEFSKDTDYRKLALLTLATRLFNDAEAVKNILLWGLPSQAQMINRDIIECIMLFRLFLNNAGLAKRWMMHSVEFQPGDVNAKLLGIGVNAREYAFYGLLSHEGHANFLASISNVQEEVVEEGMRHTFHFGSSRTPWTIFFVQYGFLDLFFLLHLLLVEPLAEYYFQHSDTVVYMSWANKVDKIVAELEDLTIEVNKRSSENELDIEKYIVELIEKKMRLKEFKKILFGNNDETTKIE